MGLSFVVRLASNDGSPFRGFLLWLTAADAADGSYCPVGSWAVVDGTQRQNCEFINDGTPCKPTDVEVISHWQSLNKNEIRLPLSLPIDLSGPVQIR